MKVSLKWLQEYINKPLSAELAIEAFNQLGLEVEGVEDFELYKGGLEGLVIGEIVEIRSHPEEASLKICTVNIGKPTTLPIVCGATNLRLHQGVALALPNSSIYNFDGEKTIIQAKRIKGQDSLGMICSAYEIGIDKEKQGILVLSAQKEHIGLPLNSLFNNVTDKIISLSITANRSESMSYLGLAKELAIFLNYKTKDQSSEPFIGLNKFSTFNESLSNLINYNIIIENTAACWRYVGIKIEKVKISSSPDWLKHKLLSIGLKSINNLVDITNFILIETGQPLHAFDAQQIKGHTIYVKHFPDDTPFITLDGKKHSLKKTDLMIADDEKPLCLAGIYGGLNSGITENTTTVFLESAFFAPNYIRQSSIHHNLRTEAALRFEKNIDINLCKKALSRATQLILEICGGTPSPIIDQYPKLPQLPEINLKYTFIKKLLGIEINPLKISEILQALDFEIIKTSPHHILIKPPSTKPDIKYPADVIEEILRIIGFDTIPLVDCLPIEISQFPNKTKESIIKNKIIQYLTGHSFYEIWTNSLVSANDLFCHEKDQAIFLKNSSSNQHNVLRPSLLQSGLEVIAYNVHRQQTSLRFFEIGTVYNNDKTARKYQEIKQLALFISGENEDRTWKKKNWIMDFYDLKTYVEGLFFLFEIQPLLWKYSTELEAIQLFSSQNLVGEVKIISPEVLNKYGLKQNVYYCCINWQLFLQLCSTKPLVFKKIPRFPYIQRDLSLLIHKDCYFDKVESLIKELNPPFLKQYSVFDLFENTKIIADKKALGLNFVFQAEDKTLTDKEIDDIMQNIQQFFIKDLLAEIRM